MRRVLVGDNRLSEIRPATRSQNQANRPRQKNNTSGYKGVHFIARLGKWAAYIHANGERTNLGCFDTPQLAAGVRNWAAEMLHGEFARAA